MRRARYFLWMILNDDEYCNNCERAECVPLDQWRDYHMPAKLPGQWGGWSVIGQQSMRDIIKSMNSGVRSGEI